MASHTFISIHKDTNTRFKNLKKDHSDDPSCSDDAFLTALLDMAQEMIDDDETKDKE